MSTRVIQFLNNSNYIEGIHEIDYSFEFFQKSAQGHYGAFVISQESAKNKECLNHKMLKKWQELIGQEQQKYTGSDISNNQIGHFRSPHLTVNVRIGKHCPPHYNEVAIHIMKFIEDVNEDLKNNINLYKEDDKQFSEFVAKHFLTFEKIHPFADGNGRVGRLLVNYFATYCKRSILIFPDDMRDQYIKAHESIEAMKDYIYLRVKEANSIKNS